MRIMILGGAGLMGPQCTDSTLLTNSVPNRSKLIQKGFSYVLKDGPYSYIGCFITLHVGHVCSKL
jgi:hypothetical protein